VKEDEGGCDDPADAPWAETDVPQGCGGHLQQRVSTLANRAFAVMGLVVCLLLVGRLTSLGFLNSTMIVLASPHTEFVAAIRQHPLHDDVIIGSHLVQGVGFQSRPPALTSRFTRPVRTR
jgi:hypothetical protein